MMVAEVDVIAVAVTDVIAGGGGARVTNVKLVDVAVVPVPFVDSTA